MAAKKQFERKRAGWHEPIPTVQGRRQMSSGLIQRPPLKVKSEVAIVRSLNYFGADNVVREAIDLLGGIKRFCGKGDNVLIKPNLAVAQPYYMAETTDPRIVGATVKICKETGAKVKVGEKAGWHIPTDYAFKKTGIGEAALAAGADEIVNWEVGERIEVKVPNARSLPTVKIHKSVIEADVFIDLPKLKNNFILGSGALTLSIKSHLGLIPQEDRESVHRQPIDMAWACCDIAKAIKDKHKLTLIDGVAGVEGATHYGHICRPGVIIASPDMVAAEAVAHSIVGYHPLESPAVQVMMKDGLGTGDLSEIDILGVRLEDVTYPFMRALTRYVQKYLNVKEYIGGTCLGCLWPMTSFPPIVDPKKTYAVVAGTRALIANPLKVDEVWLVGECACRPDHQFKGYMDKIKAAKKIIKLGTCPAGIALLKRKWEGVYDTPMLLATDSISFCSLPETVRPNVLKAAENRREGKEKRLRKK